MDKLKMHSPDLVVQNIGKIAELFPNCITEDQDENGKIRRVVDFDLLRQELSAGLVEGPRERYTLTWPGKNEAILTANAPIAKTLRPCEEESVDYENTRNLFIEGDNLDVLKLLQETYLGKVKMIYIDPPYNTGNDFIYEDDFAEDTESFLKRSNQKDEEGNRLVANSETNGRFHSDWLSMMYPRLKLAKNLLREDGVVFISIDDNEVHNLRKLCDEIFGENNFIADIVWQKKTSPDARMNISAAHDHIILYGRNAELCKLRYLPFDDERKKSFSNPDNDPRGVWASVDLTGQTGRAPKSQFYTIVTPSGKEMAPPDGRCWALAERTFKELVEDNRIWFGINGSNRPRLKKFLSESKGVRPWTWWDNKSVGHNQEASQEVKELFNNQALFDNPKPIRLIKRIIQLATNAKEEDIVLDFFAGSATTTHAMFEQNLLDEGNRRYLLIQLPQLLKVGSNEFKANSTALKAGYKTIAEIGKERIRRAGRKIKEKNPLITQNLDTGFRVFKVDSSNMKDVYYTPDELKQGQLDIFKDNIKPGRRPEDLLFQVFLDWGLDLSLPIAKETINGKKVFFVDSNAMLACFDSGITEELVKKLAKYKPLRAVFRDDGFGSDSVKINVEQIFKLLSPSTEVKSI